MLPHILLALVFVAVALLPAAGQTCFGIAIEHVRLLITMILAGYSCALVVQQFQPAKASSRGSRWAALLLGLFGVAGAAMIAAGSGFETQYLLMLPIAALVALTSWKLRLGLAFVLMLVALAMREVGGAPTSDPLLILCSRMCYLLYGAALAELRTAILPAATQAGLLLAGIVAWPVFDFALDPALPQETRLIAAFLGFGAAVAVMIYTWPEKSAGEPRKKTSPVQDRASRRGLATGEGGIDPESLEYFRPSFADAKRLSQD